MPLLLDKSITHITEKKNKKVSAKLET